METVEDPLAGIDGAATAADTYWLERADLVRWPSIPFWAYPQLRIALPSRADVTRGLAGWRPTLIHAATPFGVGLAARAAARSLGVPFVTSYHTSFPAYLRHYRLRALNAIAWPFLRWFHNSGRLTLAPSRMVADELAFHRFHDVRVWSRGVDTVRFNPGHRSEAMRAAMGAAPGDFVVAYVGRLAPEKGVHVAIDAMRRVMSEVAAPEGPEGPKRARVTFALAGDGPDEERCRATAPSGTWFAGSLSGTELSAFYASADAFVFPSLTETFGNVVLEAMASGVPVIAPDTGATLELANDDTALTFRANDPVSLAQRVMRLRDDATLREDRRARGLALSAARTWDAVWDRLVRDYADALAQ